MTTPTKLEENIILIAKEIRRLNDLKFTGKTTIEISLKDGGIGSISVNTIRKLTNQSNF